MSSGSGVDQKREKERIRKSILSCYLIGEFHCVAWCEIAMAEDLEGGRLEECFSMRFYRLNTQLRQGLRNRK